MRSNLVLASLLPLALAFDSVPVPLAGTADTRHFILMSGFSAKPHGKWKLSKDVCIEASGNNSGNKSGNVARLKNCTGGIGPPTSSFSRFFLPSFDYLYDRRRWKYHVGKVQVDGTKKCSPSSVVEKGEMGAQVELRECESTPAEAWLLEKTRKEQFADLLSDLAIVYWIVVTTTLLGKLLSRGRRAQSQSLVSGTHVASVMAVQPLQIPQLIYHRNEIAASPTLVALESTTRSAGKAAGWRLTAGIVTACTSMIFTESLETSTMIVAWDLCSKSVAMFVGERLWNTFDWSRRSFAKALALRVLGALTTLFAVMCLTEGNADVAGKIAAADAVFKTVLFFLYEFMFQHFFRTEIGRVANVPVGHVI